MIARICSTSFTSRSSSNLKKSGVLSVRLIFEMLPPCCDITVASDASDPGSFDSTVMSRPFTMRRLPLSHDTSSHNSGMSVNLLRVVHPTLCTVTPLPVVKMPTMASPGSGWQHRAMVTATPASSPLILSCGCRPARFCRRSSSAFSLMMTSGCIFSRTRSGDSLSSPTSAKTSSTRVRPKAARERSSVRLRKGLPYSRKVFSISVLPIRLNSVTRCAR